MTAWLVTGTGTEVGKTWVGARLLGELRERGYTIQARKPAQSFAPDERGGTDAELLAAVTGEPPDRVCPGHRWYEVPMAPFMAADVLGRPRLTVAELAAETVLAGDGPRSVTLVEGAGGPYSPLAHDGDTVDLARALGIGRAILVGDAGLGTINAVRLSVAALAGIDTVVHLNRFDPTTDLHTRNRAWLTGAGYVVTTDIPTLATVIESRLP